jgi:hypothetical protein
VGDARLFGLFGLDALDGVLALAGIAAGAMWLAAAGAVYLLRRPPQPPVGSRTLELGPEPPAIANLLVSRFRVTDDAVPATLLDLAARNVVEVEQRGPEVYYVRLNPSTDEPLTSYERRVLEHLRGRASDGVVPAGALTTGPQEESKRWRRAFSGEVVADAKARGLSRDALDGAVFTALTAAAVVPALFVWALWELEPAVLLVAGAVAALGWIRARHPQRETPEGMGAASRWLGVKAELEENEVFATYSPLTVELWDRLLAYGAALGAASGASRPLPMGTESDTHAWSASGGPWRPVTVRYPRFWPVGWGLDPLVALAVSIGAVIAGALALYGFGPVLIDVVEGGWPAVIVGAILLVPCLAVVLGVALLVMAWGDLRSTVEVTGPILRLRMFGDENKRRYYVAVDDGASRAIGAWKVTPLQYAGLAQGELVKVSVTRSLGCVRSIVRADLVT